MGISTFFHPRFENEFSCMIDGVGPGCPSKRPDFLVVNSGAHDIGKPLNEFALSVQKLARSLEEYRRSMVQE